MSAAETAQADRMPPEGPGGSPDEDDAGPDISWLRAIASGLVILAVGFIGGAYAANLVLTKALGLTRDARQWIATSLFLVVVIVLAFALRWLQARGWI